MRSGRRVACFPRTASTAALGVCVVGRAASSKDADANCTVCSPAAHASTLDIEMIHDMNAAVASATCAGWVVEPMPAFPPQGFNTTIKVGRIELVSKPVAQVVSRSR